MASYSNTYPLPPLDLQEEHQDALIFCAEDCPDDRERARELQEAIKGFSFNNGIQGKAIQYEDAIPFGQSRISSLDEALRFSTLCFAIYSKDLEEDRVNWHTTNASLWDTIENEAKSDTFIPVIWKDGVALPAYARERRPLDMRKNNWRNLLKKLINVHLGKRLDREKEQGHLRSRYQDMSNSATNSVPHTHHMFIPSQNQNDHWTMHHQESLGNIDVHGSVTHPHEVDAKGHGGPQFPWNYIRSLNSGRCLSVLGFVIVSFIMIKWKARQLDT